MKKLKFPIVLRKTMIRELNLKSGEIQRINACHKEEMENLKKQLDAHLPKLVEISLEDDKQFDNYVIRLALEKSMVRKCFIHGNSQWMISMVAARVGHMIEGELRTINFERL